MLCKRPIIVGLSAFGCGQCIPCRINRRRMWSHRIILEALCHEMSSFVTLTYDEDNLPKLDGSGLATLQVKDFTDWLKRLRKACEPSRIRYFGVGEYGDDTGRPHYHVALFGFAPCIGCFNDRLCGPCSRVRSTWGKGHTLNGFLTPESAAYVAGYVVKKMTGKDDERLQGRTPEFARMSRMPGLGADALWEFGDRLMQYNLEEYMPDVPANLRHGRRVLPLGRYLRRELRSRVGLEKNAPEATLAEAQEKLRILRESAEDVASRAPGHVRKEIFKAAFADAITGVYEAASSNLVARNELFKKRGRL